MSHLYKYTESKYLSNLTRDMLIEVMYGPHVESLETPAVDGWLHDQHIWEFPFFYFSSYMCSSPFFPELKPALH
jgi:hypothetical protein